MAFKTYSVTVGTSAVSLVPSNYADYPNARVTVVPDTTNTANLYVGDSTLTAGTTPATNGVLVPISGLYLDVGDPTKLYGRSTSADQEVFVLIQY